MIDELPTSRPSGSENAVTSLIRSAPHAMRMALPGVCRCDPRRSLSRCCTSGSCRTPDGPSRSESSRGGSARTSRGVATSAPGGRDRRPRFLAFAFKSSRFSQHLRLDVSRWCNRGFSRSVFLVQLRVARLHDRERLSVHIASFLEMPHSARVGGGVPVGNSHTLSAGTDYFGPSGTVLFGCRLTEFAQKGRGGDLYGLAGCVSLSSAYSWRLMLSLGGAEPEVRNLLRIGGVTELRRAGSGRVHTRATLASGCCRAVAVLTSSSFFGGWLTFGSPRRVAPRPLRPWCP